MASAVIPEIVSQHFDGASFLWLLRSRAVDAPHFGLDELAELDDRLEANIDGLRVAAEEGWKLSLAALADLEGGAFFSAALLAIESTNPVRLEHVINAALEFDNGGADQTELGPWRGFVSAIAWAQQIRNVRAIDRFFLDAAQPRLRWLAVSAYGCRRATRQTNWERALDDPVPLVQARAAKTAGQLGRSELTERLAAGLAHEDQECRFWSAWATARMGATAPLNVLSEIAWNGGQRSNAALELLLRRLEVGGANAWLRELARIPERKRSVISSTGVIGDPLYIPWLIERMAEPAEARLAGEAFSMITGIDLDHRAFSAEPPADFQSGPNDDPEDENVALDEGDRLPWPDPAKVGDWWTKNKSRFSVGTGYFLGQPKASADWLGALSDAFQRQRRAAALELAIRQPNKAMFEVRARGRLQRQLIARAHGEA